MADNIVHLPFRNLDPKDPMFATYLDRNFKEIEQMLTLLQKYMKNTGKAVDQQVLDSAPVWNRASNINSDGTFPTGKLSDKLVGLQHELQLVDEAVTSAKIAVSAVQSGHILDAAITESKIAPSAVNTSHIKNGAIPVVKTNYPYHQIY